MENFIGKVFGSLLVTSMKSKGWYVCKCLNCGKENVDVETWSIKRAMKSGHNSSCGCLRRLRKGDLIGQRFGYLEVTGAIRKFCPNMGKKGKYRYFAICKCYNCGKDGFSVIEASLKRGSTTSCGCSKDGYVKITGKNSVQFTGYEEIRGKTWGTFQKRAARKGRKFNITIEQAWKLYEEQGRVCALTGLPISFGKHNGETTASLDRIDSKKGYELDNVQWLHKDVNLMKNVYSMDRFIEICVLIANRRNKFRTKQNFEDFQ